MKSLSSFFMLATFSKTKKAGFLALKIGQNGTNRGNVPHNKVITFSVNFPSSNHVFSSKAKN